MRRYALALMALAAASVAADAQDTTRIRRDSRRPAYDTTDTARGQRAQRGQRGEMRGRAEDRERGERDDARRQGQQRGQRSARADWGLTHDQIHELQQALADMGCNPGPVDGIIGPRTRRAIACARRERGLEGNNANELFRSLNLGFTVQDSLGMGVIMRSGAQRDRDRTGDPREAGQRPRRGAERDDVQRGRGARDTTQRGRGVRDNTQRGRGARDTTHRGHGVRDTMRTRRPPR